MSKETTVMSTETKLQYIGFCKQARQHQRNISWHPKAFLRLNKPQDPELWANQESVIKLY